MSSYRSPYKFYEAYCDFKTTEYGIQADGRTARAETELVRRLQPAIMIKRPRSEIWASQPPKDRQVLRVEADASFKLKEDATDREGALYTEINRVLQYKLPHIIDNVMSGLAANEKAVVWAVTHEGVRVLTEAIEKAAASREHAARLRNVNFDYWTIHGVDGQGEGVTSKRRNEIAMAYRRHKGAALIISTVQALSQSISLGPLRVVENGKTVEYEGAHTEHFTSLHPEAGMLLQGENRPYEMGVRGLTIIYYLLKTASGNSVDERMEPRVFDRMRTLEKLQNEQDATSLLAALKVEEASLDSLWKDMFAAMDSDSEVALDDDAPLEFDGE